MRMILFILLVSLQVSAQEMTLRKGVVIDSLPVNDTIDESFSLFLPMSFQSSGAPTPIIFVFDSEGRGKTVAQLFKPAAQEQGYIVASSNDIHPENGFEENVKVAARLINGVISLIPVDYNSISAAGFSEGARVATAIPLVFNNIHGVIAVSDQQINYNFINDRNKFMFVGMAGDKDFSSYGIRNTASQLDRFGFPVAAYFFDGGNEWPDPELISLGLGSLTLQAMKDGKRPKDPQLITTLYNRDMGRVNKLISTGESMQAYDLLSHLQAKYEVLLDISELKDKQKQLRRSRNFTEQRREAREIEEKEMRLVDDFIYYFNEDVATANYENLGWWNYQKRQLEELTKSESEPEADMAFRLLSMVKELVKAKRTELKTADEASLEAELLANMIQTIFDQQNFDAYKTVISLSAQDRDYSTALFYLEEMLKNGYDDMEALYEIPGTLALKMTPEFNWLVRKYLGSSKYYDVPAE